MLSKRRIGVIVLAISLGALLYAACDQPSDRYTSNTTPGSPSPTATAMTGGSAALSEFDREFMMDAARGGMMEVRLGNLAAERAASLDVKQFAQRMVTDHGQANQQLQQLASRLNVTLPQDLKPEQQQLMDRMQKLSGKAFDQAYMSEMVKDHAKDVAEYERASNQATNPELKTYATQTLAVLRDHQTQAHDVAAKVGAGGR